MHKSLSVIALALGVILAPAIVPKTPVLAQEQAGRPEVTPAVRHDTSIPLSQMQALPIASTRQDYTVKLTPQTPSGAQEDLAVQRFAVAPLAAVVGTSFDGVGEGHPIFFYNVGSAPPDTVGEAGLTQYVQWVNTSFAVFDKATGTPLYGPAGGNTLWTGFGGPCQTRNDGDPIVQYDQLADRWIMTQFALQAGNYLQCVAISATSDALGAWHRYAFSYAEFPDYPKLSVWPDAYYITFNMFVGNTFTGGRICAYDRTRMLSGLSATQVCVQNNAYASALGADLDGKTLPPLGTASYVLNRSGSGVNLWRFSVNFTNGTASITGPTALPVAGYTPACLGGPCIPQPSTTQLLDALGDRLMYRASYRNLGSRAALLASHSVASGGVVNVRWYEIDVTNPTATVRQQATYAPADGNYRWMGSIAMDQIGNIAVGYSVSSGGTRPAIRFAGRDVGDPLNTLSTETEMQTGIGSQTTNLSRWGDYSSMTIDPVDDCTFWYTSEFLKTSGTFNWSTRISSFKFLSCTGPPQPGFSLGVTPASQTVTQGQSTTFSATVTSQNGYTGNGTYSVTGLPANTTASFAPTGYTGGSGASTLTVNTTATTPTGSYPLTVTATDSGGTPTESTIVTLTVNSGGPAGPVGHWAFDETSGTTASDSSGNGNAGVLVNGPSWNPAGKVSGALSFDGVNDYVSLGNPASLVPGSAITLAGWAKFNNVSSTRFIISKDDGISPQNATFLRYQANSGIRCSIGGTSVDASASIAVGVWYHTACTYDGAMIRVYVNGVQAQTLAKTGPIVDEAGTNWLIGARTPANPGLFMNGLLDDIHLFNRALSAAEVSQLFNGAGASFSLGVTPASQTVTQGQSTTFSATVTSQNGYAGNGTYSVTGLPANTTASFAPAGYTGGSGASTLTVNTTATTPTGSHALTVTATDSSGTPTQSTIVTLTVNSGGPAGPVGHWAFDETSGTTASDSSGNGNAGVLVNGPSWNPAGMVNGALSFDGVNDYVSLGNPASLIPGSAITLAGWAKFNDVSGTRFIISKDDGISPQNATFLRYQTGSGILCSIGGTSVLAPASIAVGVWYHTACTYDGAMIRVYVNGVQVQTLVKTGPIADEVGMNWLIGARRPANPVIFMNGLLDDIRIYNRALSAAEVSQLFTGTGALFSMGVTPAARR